MPVSQRKKGQRKYSTKFITRPDDHGHEENLFYQSIPVYEASFPENERDPIDNIKEWIIESRIAEEKNEPDGDPWRDLYAVLHNDEEVIGMAYLTAHLNFPWVFGGYWCINSFDRGDNLDYEFLNRIEAHLQKVVPGLKGIVFEITWIDVDYLKDVIAQGESFSVDDRQRLIDNVRALERLLLFERRDALPVLAATNDCPFPYVQPPLEPPFDYEKQMILMVRTQKNIRLEDIELDELLTFIYDHVYHDSFDPKIGKIHVQGFEARLADITSRVRNAAKAGRYIHSLTPLRGFAALCGRLKAQGYNIRP